MYDEEEIEIMNMFIKSISLDELGRVVTIIHDQFSDYLITDASKKMLKEMAIKALGDSFVKLEVAKSSFRITVVEGAEETSKEIIEREILKGIEMAMAFMSQMQNTQE